MAAKENDRDLIGTIGRCVNTLRDALLTALIIFWCVCPLGFVAPN